MLENVMVHNSYEFLDLGAQSDPTADPTAPYIKAAVKYRDDKEKEDEMRALSNWQFMVLGAFMGILATIIYYQIARFYQKYRESQTQMVLVEPSERDSQRQRSRPVPQDDPGSKPTILSKRKNFKEDESLGENQSI
jgi:hypothetical protein